MLSQQNTETIDHRTLRQFILDEIPLTDSAEVTEGVRLSIFSSIFYHTIHAFKAAAIKTLAPLLAFVTFIGLTHEYFASRREQNKNKVFKHLLNGLFFTAEVIAIFFFVTSTLVSAVVAPAIFVAVSATKFLISLTKSIYYLGGLAHAYYNKWFNHEDETYTQQFAHTWEKLKRNLKDTLIGGIICAGISIAFFAPEVVGLPVIAAPVALAFKWLTCVTLGALSLWSFTHKYIEKYKKSKWPSVPKNDPMREPLIEQKPSFKLSDKLHLTDEIKLKYRKNGMLHLANSDVDDLLIKMEVLHEEKTEGTNLLDLQYLQILINQERAHIHIGERTTKSQKLVALNLLEKLIAGKNLNLTWNGAYYENSVLGITRYYHDQETLKPILTSYFSEVGGMQKIFLLVDHYCKMNPDVIFKAKIDEQTAETDREKIHTLKNEVLSFKSDAKQLTYALQGSNKTIEKASEDIKNYKQTIKNQLTIIENKELTIRDLKDQVKTSQKEDKQTVKNTQKEDAYKKRASSLVKNSIYTNPFDSLELPEQYQGGKGLFYGHD